MLFRVLLIVGVSFCLVHSVWAAVPSGFDKCRPQIARQLARLKSVDKWKPLPSIRGKDKRFKTPTKKFGRWLILEQRPKKKSAVRILSLDRFTGQSFEFDQKCKAKARPLKFKSPQPRKGQASFNDKNFKSLLKSKKKYVIYTWSPGMVYSAKALPLYKKIVEKAGFGFVAVLDPWAPKKAAQKAATKLGFSFAKNRRRIHSRELLMRDLTVHYPSILIVKNGKILEKKIMGIMSPEEIRRHLLTAELSL